VVSSICLNQPGLLVDQDAGILENAPHLLGVGDEAGRDVAAVELHALDHVEDRASPLHPVRI
jgi:hypothetical protein